MSRADRARQATLALLAALLVLLAAETLLFAPAGTAPAAIAFVLALKLLPLAAFLPGLRARHVRTALWLGFLLMPYFVWSVLGAMAPGSEGALALLRALLISATFLAAVFYARWQGAPATSA